MRKLKVILSLVILGLMALTGWAYLGEYTPAPAGMSIPLVAAEPAAGAADGN